MRSTLVAAFCVGALHVCAIDAHAQNRDSQLDMSADPTRSQLQLRMAPLVPHITTLDRRYTLQSGFDPEARPGPADARFSLHSKLLAGSNLSACADGDAIFADGFQ